jgi:hypothetical protein
VLWLAVVTAADTEFCAEQTLTAPAVAAIMIAALNIFVNFISFSFLFTGCTRPGGDESLRAVLPKGVGAKMVQGSGYDLEIALGVVPAKVEPLQLSG